MVEERAQRRLAHRAADVVRYSRLIGADEAHTLAALTARRREIVNPLHTEHRGRIITVMGDVALVEFASAVDTGAYMQTSSPNMDKSVRMPDGLKSGTAVRRRDRESQFG
jgi:class 3 adenylate cyclase